VVYFRYVTVNTAHTHTNLIIIIIIIIIIGMIVLTNYNSLNISQVLLTSKIVIPLVFVRT